MDKSLLKLMFRTVIAICASVLLLFVVSKCQGPLPDNVMLFTVNVVNEDCITLRNAEGKYLTNDKLAWADTMEEGIITWRLNARNGAWQLLTTGDDRPKALEIYKANLSTYTAEPRDNFCFNFYEPLSRD